MIKEIKDDGLDGLDVSVDTKIDSDFIQIIKQNKLKLVVWTVNDIEQAGFFCQSGIYGITTDRPVWLRDNICNRVLD
jgi:glycerophosphoryl diester phosphodiesterase